MPRPSPPAEAAGEPAEQERRHRPWLRPTPAARRALAYERQADLWQQQRSAQALPLRPCCHLEAAGQPQLVLAEPWAQGAFCRYGLGLRVGSGAVVGVVHRQITDRSPGAGAQPRRPDADQLELEQEALWALDSPLSPQQIYSVGAEQFWQVAPMPCSLAAARRQLPADSGASERLALGAWTFFCGAQQLARLEAGRLLHGDVSPDNLLAAPAGDVVVADLNGCGRLGLDGRAAWQALTPAFSAPECLTEARVGPSADSWGLGMTALWTIFAVPLLGPASLQVHDPASFARYAQALQQLCGQLPEVRAALAGADCPAALAATPWWPQLAVLAAGAPRWARYLMAHIFDTDPQARHSPAQIARELPALAELQPLAAAGRAVLARAAQPSPHQAPTLGLLVAYRQTLLGHSG